MLLNQQPPHIQETDVKKSDLEAMNFKQLKSFMDAANARMNDMRAKEIQDARASVQEKCDELGITIYELMGIAPIGAPRAKGKGNGTSKAAAPKYKLPDGELWTGRGRLPIVLRDALKGAEGYSEQDASFDSKEAREAALKQFLI